MPDQTTSPAGPGADPDGRGFELLEGLATASWRSEVLFTALELNIFALLGRESRTPARLGQSTGWDPDALERLLEALVEVGLLVKAREGFANAPPAARHLLPESPHYMGDFLAYRRYIAGHWQRLADRVRLGPRANERPEQESQQAYTQRVAAYVTALDVQARLKARQAMDRLRLLIDPPPARVLDLGGGAGSWCRAALGVWPEARATLVDLPEVITAAKDVYSEPGHWQGIQALGGDCRSLDLPRNGFDLIVASNLLHAYGEPEARAIVKHAAGLLAPAGTLLIHDYFTEETGGDPLKGRLYDLHMLINTYNGRIHARGGIAAMLEEAGLDAGRMIELPGDTSLIMAQPGKGGAARVSGDDLLFLAARDMGFERAGLIRTQDIKVEPWVAAKCRFGCRRYGGGLQCPPHSPNPQTMAGVLGGYKRGLLVQGAPPSKQFHRRLLALERHCFLGGMHQALAFGAGPCTVCPECDVTQPCRFPDQARPAMEACGIDVFQTVHAAGWDLRPLSDPGDYVKYIGLVLLD